LIWFNGTAVQQGFKRKGKLPFSTKLFQGIGALPDTYKNFAFNTFLLFYYNQVLGYSATLVSAVLLVALIFDAVTDPVVGSISDNLHTSLGRRHPLMYIASLPLALSIYLVFSPPSGASFFTVSLWLGFFTIVARGSMTLFLVPWTAMMAEMSDDYEERTSVVAYRYFLGWTGSIILTFSIWTFVFPSTVEFTPGHLNPEGYPVMAGIISTAIFLAVLFTTHLTRREIPYLKAPPEKPLPFSFQRVLGEIMGALSNRNFALIFAAILLLSIIGGVKGALDIYVNTYFWGLNPEQLRWFAFAIVGAILAVIALPHIQRRFDKKQIYITATILAIVDGVTMISLRFLDILPDNGTDLLLYILLGAVTFTVFVLTMVGIVGPSVIADILDQQELETGSRQEGMFFAALSFSGKSISGFGGLIGGVIIDLVALPIGAKPSDVDPRIIMNLGIAAGIILPLLNLIPMWLLSKYDMTREDLAEIQLQIARKRTVEKTL